MRRAVQEGRGQERAAVEAALAEDPVEEEREEREADQSVAEEDRAEGRVELPTAPHAEAIEGSFPRAEDQVLGELPEELVAAHREIVVPLLADGPEAPGQVLVKLAPAENGHREEDDRQPEQELARADAEGQGEEHERRRDRRLREGERDEVEAGAGDHDLEDPMDAGAERAHEEDRRREDAPVAELIRVLEEDHLASGRGL